MKYDQFETDSGLLLNVPAEGRSQCWHIPLPCTPYPNADIAERLPGDLRHGFRSSIVVPDSDADE